MVEHSLPLRAYHSCYLGASSVHQRYKALKFSVTEQQSTYGFTCTCTCTCIMYIVSILWQDTDYRPILTLMRLEHLYRKLFHQPTRLGTKPGFDGV